MRFVNKIKISPSLSQSETFNFWLRKCKNLYNAGLEQRIISYTKCGKSIGYYEQKKELVSLKQEDNSYKDVPNKSLTETLNDLDKAYKSFFKGSGFPKFKNIDNFNSIYFVKDDIRIKNGILFLPKIKTRIKLSEEVKPNYTSVRLKKENKVWFLIFNYEDDKLIKYYYELDKTYSSIGCDLGLKTLMTDSNGYEVRRFNLKLLGRYVNRISEINKSLSRCKKGSKNRKKVKNELTKTYLRLKNSRDDYHNKESNSYVKECKRNDIGVIVIGDLQVKKIIEIKNKDGNKDKSKRYLRRSFSNSGISNFKNKLSNKCEREGLRVYKVNESLTTKTCSCCGHVDFSIKLSDRVYDCKKCNKVVSRDVNGAINIQAVWQGQFKPWSLDSQGELIHHVQKK